MQINQLSENQVRQKFQQCCASTRWVSRMLADRPFRDAAHLYDLANKNWIGLIEADYLEAFAGHPKIGDIKSLRAKYASTADQAAKEQSGIESAGENILANLAEKNRQYESRFGFIFIVCATGKSAAEMLAALLARLGLDRKSELQNAAEQQRQIFQLRLQQLIQKGE